MVFSNPFGYGPTGNIVPVIDSLLNSAKEVNVFFAGSRLCREIINNGRIRVIDIDERNEGEIRKFLGTIKDPHIISSQNRFAIRVAKGLGKRCAFLDTLAWFWKEIPQDHLLADLVFWVGFPNVDRAHPDKVKVKVVSGITCAPRNAKKKNQMIIHIGGAKYPFGGIPVNYLDLLAAALDGFGRGKAYERVLCVGGSEAIEYLRSKCVNKNIFLASLPNDEFIREMSESAHMFTTAGITATLESVNQQVPVSFLPPINLSQFALTQLLEDRGLCPKFMRWDNYVSVRGDLADMTEKNAIKEFAECAKKTFSTPGIKAKFIDDFAVGARTIPDNSKQLARVGNTGKSGAREISDILIKEWGLGI